MKPLHRARHFLQNNLSLSSKIFLKRMLATVVRPFSRVAARPQSTNNTGPEIIVFDDRVPIPDRDAGSARMVNILKSLAHIGSPVFIPMKRLPEHERLLWENGIEIADVGDYVRLIKKRNFRLAILSRPEVAEALIPSLRQVNRQMKIVFDMVDASFVRLSREYQVTGVQGRAEEAWHLEELELGLAEASDQVWCASPADKKAVSKRVPEERIAVIPTIHALKTRGKSWSEREGLLFIGHLSHRPNSDAIHYFMQEIFPLIRKSCPSLIFNIIGSNPSAEIKAYHSEQVRVMGYVPDIDPFFHSAHVFIAPLRFGAGVNGKIGEALSYGLPVVTTSIGAEGLGLVHGRDAMIADNPLEFAEHVLEVYRNNELWQRLSDCGYQHIENYFTPKVIGERIETSLRNLGIL